MDLRLRDLERGEERVGRELSHLRGHQWWEYWDFLQTYADFSAQEGVTLLEDYLRER